MSISSYSVNDQDVVRRIYIGKGPCRPRPNGDFSQTLKVNRMRRFRSIWYDKYDWLEYSEEKDAAFCSQRNVFATEEFNNWKTALDRFKKHVGNKGNAHNDAKQKYEYFINKQASIIELVEKVSNEARSLYKSRLLYSLSCVIFLLKQELAFRGHNESAASSNKGNFLELFDWLGKNNENVAKLILTKAPENHHVTCQSIQKELIKYCAQEITKLIIDELNGDFFAILADESCDVSHKEELAICLRYLVRRVKFVKVSLELYM